MIGRVLRVCVLALVGLGLVAACGSSDRPSELSMSGVNPCDLISRSDRQRLDVKAEPQPVPIVEGPDEDGKGCIYLPLSRELVTISKVMNHGIGRWTSGSFDRATVKEVRRIRGFHTIKVGRTYLRAGPRDRCTLYVDVADDQSLKVEVAETSEDGPPTCDVARRFADAAMETLIMSN